MLFRLTLLLIALPLAALAADAPPGGKITVPPPPKAAPAPPIPAAVPVSLPAPSPPPAQDASECRRSCAESYYFCRAGDEPENCGGPWGQCLATCNSPADAPSPN